METIDKVITLLTGLIIFIINFVIVITMIKRRKEKAHDYFENNGIGDSNDSFLFIINYDNTEKENKIKVEEIKSKRIVKFLFLLFIVITLFSMSRIN